ARSACASASGAKHEDNDPRWLLPCRASPGAPAQVNRQQRHVRRGDAAEAQRLAEGARGEAHKRLPRLATQAGDGRVVEVGRDELRLEPRELLELARLALEIAVVLGPHL